MPDSAPVTLVTLSFKIIENFPLFFYVIDFVIFLFERGVQFLIMTGVSMRGMSKKEDSIGYSEFIYFQACSRLHSVLRVAEKLGYFQSNVSQHMKILENDLGNRLIHSNCGIRMAEKGIKVLDYVEDILKLM
ncbi:LysR family transcriptional regulator [Exiguobacterium sp. RIT452]|uniref:helix-turn-helix domain-containing protein n=1 Tax=Exiguobacterium sp. RIT452 TaxID=2315552 RepID=UPI000E76E670|nr:LysR family transcriptional regulator [Exiguobacterium sp. RIT452]